MAIRYNKLWKLLIDKGMTKTELRIKAGLTTDDEPIDDEAAFLDLTKRFLASLDDDTDRDIVIFKLKGKTQSEIAETLGFSQSAIAKRLKRIRVKYDVFTNE